MKVISPFSNQVVQRSGDTGEWSPPQVVTACPPSPECELQDMPHTSDVTSSHPISSLLCDLWTMGAAERSRETKQEQTIPVHLPLQKDAKRIKEVIIASGALQL